jgi:hypothetical protein
MDFTRLEIIIPLAIVAFLVFFVLWWSFIVFLLSRIGGWGKLAAAYRFDGSFVDYEWPAQTAQMRWGVNYKRVLTVGANPEGLYLNISRLFWMGHAPLFIPWFDISVSTGKFLWGRYIEFRFRQAPSVRFRVKEQLGLEISRVAGASWPDQTQRPW